MTWPPTSRSAASPARPCRCPACGAATSSSTSGPPGAPLRRQPPGPGQLHDTFGADKRLAILGLNIDEDPAQARRFVADRKLPGIHASLGDRPDEQDQLLTRYSISSVPAYILIGPDGKLVHRGSDIEEVAEVLKRLLR